MPKTGERLPGELTWQEQLWGAPDPAPAQPVRNNIMSVKNGQTSIPCRTCGKPVEPQRECYAIPTCYSCLPPPNLKRVGEEIFAQPEEDRKQDLRDFLKGE